MDTKLPPVPREPVGETFGWRDWFNKISQQCVVKLGNNIVVTLPTADPHIVGALWNSSGTVKVSAG